MSSQFAFLVLILIPLVRYKSDDRNAEPNRFFFPVRYVDFRDPHQLEVLHPDFARITTETESDKALLTSLVQLIGSKGGVLDTRKLAFMYMKDVHPNYDHRLVCLLNYFDSIIFLNFIVLIRQYCIIVVYPMCISGCIVCIFTSAMIVLRFLVFLIPIFFVLKYGRRNSETVLVG